MRVVEVTGRSIDEAIQAALKKLEAEPEDIDVEILEEPSRGLFGLIGARQAKIKVTLQRNPVDVAVQLLEKVFQTFKIDAEIEVKRKNDMVNINFKGRDLGIMIGRRGDTLNALQYLVNLVANRHQEARTRFVLDVEGYRYRREQTLTKLAKRLSVKVKKTKKNIVLEPMSPHERKVVHSALQNDPVVYTFSEGDEPYRKVVISLKNKFTKR